MRCWDCFKEIAKGDSRLAGGVHRCSKCDAKLGGKK
jgi:hypothetical protein